MSLASVGNVVDSAYRHVVKRITPRAALVRPDVYLKWYDLSRADQSISHERDTEARAFIAAELAAARLPISGDLGFVVHHLAGEHVLLLLVFTWRENNEMWESAYWKDARKADAYQLLPQGSHRAVMCVWELGAVAHEHVAWTKYLRSARDEAAKGEYVRSQYSGDI